MFGSFQLNKRVWGRLYVVNARGPRASATPAIVATGVASQGTVLTSALDVARAQRTGWLG